MAEPVMLHVEAEPYHGDDDDGLLLDGNKVVGRVKRGSTVLHTKEIITDNTIESVCGVKERIALEIELWAVQNTDFSPIAEHMP